MLRARPLGFTLTEVLLSMVFGSVIILAAMQLYPTLLRQSQNTVHYFRLEQRFQEIAFSIEKDLRRAGFCALTCKGEAVMLGQFAGETTHSCVNIAYDLTRRYGEQRNRERFGYRLRAGAIETQVGLSGCGEAGWERLLDPQEVRVTHFQVRAHRQPGGLTLYEVQLAGYWTKRPEIRRQIVRWIVGRNT